MQATASSFGTQPSPHKFFNHRITKPRLYVSLHVKFEWEHRELTAHRVVLNDFVESNPAVRISASLMIYTQKYQIFCREISNLSERLFLTEQRK